VFEGLGTFCLDDLNPDNFYMYVKERSPGRHTDDLDYELFSTGFKTRDECYMQYSYF